MVNVKAITDERFQFWKVQCIRRNATPQMALAIGHDHREGEITVLTTKGIEDSEISLLLQHAISALNPGNISIVIDGITALTVLSQLQLATRHPKNTGPGRKQAEVFARELQKRIEQIMPEHSALMQMGWDQNFDVEEN